MPDEHQKDEQESGEAPAITDCPANRHSGKPVKNKEPNRHHGCGNMSGIEDGSPGGGTDLEDSLNPGQQHSGNQEKQAGNEKAHTRFDCPSVGVRPGSLQVPEAENHKR